MLYQHSFHAQCRRDWPALCSNCCHLVGFWQRSTFSMTRNLLSDRQISPRRTKNILQIWGVFVIKKRRRKAQCWNLIYLLIFCCKSYVKIFMWRFPFFVSLIKPYLKVSFLLAFHNEVFFKYLQTLLIYKYCLFIVRSKMRFSLSQDFFSMASVPYFILMMVHLEKQHYIWFQWVFKSILNICFTYQSHFIIEVFV